MSLSVLKMIKQDFQNWTRESYLLLLFSVLVQGYMFTLADININNVAMTIASIFGVITVLMISNKKMSNAIFGILSSSIIIYSAIQHRIFADALLQLGYILVLDIPILLFWAKKRTDNGEITGINKLSTITEWIKYVLIAAGITVVSTFILSLPFINDTQPFIDALGFSIGITGGILCVKRNQSQFVFWALQGFISMILWFRASLIAGTGLASPLAVMYCIYLINDWIGWSSYGKSIKNKDN